MFLHFYGHKCLYEQLLFLDALQFLGGIQPGLELVRLIAHETYSEPAALGDVSVFYGGRGIHLFEAPLTLLKVVGHHPHGHPLPFLQIHFAQVTPLLLVQRLLRLTFFLQLLRVEELQPHPELHPSLVVQVIHHHFVPLLFLYLFLQI